MFYFSPAHKTRNRKHPILTTVSFQLDIVYRGRLRRKFPFRQLKICKRPHTEKKEISIHLSPTRLQYYVNVIGLDLVTAHTTMLGEKENNLTSDVVTPSFLVAVYNVRVSVKTA